MELIKIKVKNHDGQLHEIEAPTNMGLNLMELIKAAELPVEGTCGGMALCATCHCYIKSGHELPAISEQEELMLDQLFNLTDQSRLGCQLRLSPELHNLEIELPPLEN